jgi:hypothetical protein
MTEGNVDEPGRSRLYVIDAEVTFADPVVGTPRHTLEDRIAHIHVPGSPEPKVRWATPRRALASDIAIMAESKAAAVDAGRAALRGAVLSAYGIEPQTVAVMSLRLGTF